MKPPVNDKIADSIMHVLITGAGSFIGRFVIRKLSDAGWQVTATYHSESPVIEHLRQLPNSPALLRLDIGKQQDFHLLPRSMDAVIHIAAISNKPGYTVADILNCNINGTYNIQQYALNANAGCLVYMSSLSVHGNISVPLVDITTPVVNSDIYGISKYMGERLLEATSGKLPVAAVRLPGVLGTGASRSWIPRLLDRFLKSEDVTIFNPQAEFNNAIHVYDLADFILQVISGPINGYSAFPIGSSGTISIGQLAEHLKNATGSGSKIIVATSKANSFKISSEYAINRFSYRPKLIKDTIDCYLKDLLVY